MSKITVTKEQVQENMQDIIVRTLDDFGKPTTYVTVKMKNGFTIRESTTCVDPANYDEEIGKQICLEKIEDKIWFLLGYALQNKLVVVDVPKELPETANMMESTDYKQRFRAEYFQLLIRYQKLCNMVEKWDKGELNFTPTCPRAVYDVQLRHMKGYLETLQHRAGLEGVDVSSGEI